MAQTLLDGFNANISFKTQRYSAGTLAGSALEHACWANALSLRGRQDVISLDKTVFCVAPGWKEKASLGRDVVGTISGFASKGDAASAPFDLLDGNKVAITAVLDDPTPTTAGTDVCSIAFDAFLNTEDLGVVAKGNSNRAIAFESTGTVTKAWVIA